jgi:hypothetical protein
MTKHLMDLADAYADTESDYMQLDFPGVDDVIKRNEVRAALLAAVEAQSKELEELKDLLSIVDGSVLQAAQRCMDRVKKVCDERTVLQTEFEAAKESATLWNKRYQDVCQDRIALRQKYGHEIQALESQLDDALKLIDDRAAPVAPQQEYTYSSTQATNCAQCGKHKHTPLRIDAMGGYVCLTCIDKKLGSMLGEFGYPEAQPVAQPAEALTDEQLEAEFCSMVGLETGINPAAADTKRALIWFKKGYRFAVAQPAYDEAALTAKGWRLQDCKICGESASAYVSPQQPADLSRLEPFVHGLGKAILRELQKAQQPAEALTDAEIKAGWEKTFSTDNPYCPCNLKSFTKAVNWALKAKEKP